MIDTLNGPRLTAFRTLENSQGTLDPLGLYTVSDRLAGRLAPGLRERMKHPRYLTASAVSSVVCSVFDEEMLATDGISAPWQVFEWYVASGLVKTFDKTEPHQLLGMPGRGKTTAAIKQNLPLNAARYLKTPSVFGFHGVYRTLAKNMNLVEGRQPGDFGMKLVETWEEEQGLKGFQLGSKGSAGNDLRNKLQEAVRRGLEAAAVAKPWAWEPYKELATSLAPKSPGKREARLLLDELRGGSGGVREPLLNQIASTDGQRILAADSEKLFHEWMIDKGAGDLQLLKAIRSYEKLCRLLYNAFYEVVMNVRDRQNKGNISELSVLQHVKKASKEVPAALSRLESDLVDFSEEAGLVQENLGIFSEKLAAPDWLIILFDHHTRIQRSKLPAKAPWILEHSKGSYLLNTTQDLQTELSDEYVHQYRTFTLRSFLFDLKK